ncbi:MAG: hypothetical protein D6718_12465 [Acidobacteria bacterium]|nr:MAG: hypothetical protein D6718_12465 [Acidobacteriota bacterium]
MCGLPGESWSARSTPHHGYELFHPLGVALEVDRHRGPYYPARDPAAPPTTRYGRIVYEGWKQAFREILSLGRERGWPPLWFYLIDEPHHSRGAMRLAILMARAAQEAGADGMITCNEPTVSEPDPDKRWFPPVGDEPALMLEPWVKTRCYHNRYLGPETRERTRQAGDRYGTYINIYGNQPASTRYLAGFLAWRLGLDLVMLWQRKNASKELEGVRVWLRDWEAAREGIDDIRYIEALERAVESGVGAPGAIAKARELLARLEREIVPTPEEIGYVDGVTGRWVPGKRAWAPERYDEIRAEVARAIAALGEAP